MSKFSCPRVKNRTSLTFICSAILAISASAAFAQNVNVNPGAGSYPTLKGAFDAINAGTHTGAITVDVVASTTETASAVLNASGVGAASYTSIVISPSGGSWTVSGSIAGHLIDLNGADNVTIDGLNNLTIDNSSATATTSTIRLIGDASSNVITNCTIKGAGTSTTAGTIFVSTGTTTGNVSNTISNNTITNSGANFPANAIHSLGTSAAIFNSGTISGNNVQDYFSAASVSVGINLAGTGNSAWTISNNKLFQSATRIYTAANTHNGINVGTGSGYTITGNTIGFANAGGTGTTNIVGNTVVLTGTFPTSYTTTGTANATRYIAINCAFTAGGAASSIQNNTVAGIALYTSSGAATTNGILCGINVTSGNANIGTTTGNTIGATTGGGGASASSLYAACTTTGGTVVGIFATSTNTVNIQNNTIGSVDSSGTTATQSGGITAIDTAGTAGVFTINSNTIGSTTADNIRTGFMQTAGSLSNSGALVSTTGATATLIGIRNTATGTTLNINSNTLQGWAVGGTVTVVTGITNTGSVTTTVNNNSNLLGTATRGWVRYAFANSGALTGILKSGTATATAISISSNDFQGIVNSVAGSQAHTYISFQVGAVNNYNSNTFTNLNVNTTGSVTFINHGTTNSMTATGTLASNSNQIVTGFNKASAGGTVTFFTAGAGDVSPNGSTIQYNLNNFSNVTLTGATAVLALSDANGASSTSGPTKTITNNTFNNITTGVAQITGISFNFSGNNTLVSSNTLTNLTGGLILSLAAGTSNSGATETISNNTFSNFTASGQINALQTGFGTVTTGNITGNTISNLSSSAATANPIFPIICSGFGVTNNITKNKICNVQSTGNVLAGSAVFGILAQTAGTTYNITNNLVGDLRLPVNPAPNNLNGISIGVLTAGTTVNVSYNTVRLNESVNAAAGFGSSALFASTTPTVVLRNNILVNTSVFNGSGLTVAYRRSDATLTTYGAASNNNDYYAGTPGTNNLIYNDVTNSDSTIGAYKTRVATRDSASFSENPTFLSTTCGDPTFLHIDPSVVSLLESGGTPIAGITDDYDGDTRNVGTPDVGADEFNGAVDVQGACCLPTGCQFISQTACTNAGSNQWFSGVACVDSSCPLTGRCCSGVSPVSCSMLTQAACLATTGNSWDGGLTCSTPCETVSCCLPNGSCQDLTVTGCNTQNGTPGLTGSSCGTNNYSLTNMTHAIEDIMSTGTGVTFTAVSGSFGVADEGFSDLAMPIPFKYFGVTQANLRIYTNGLITFDTVSAPVNTFTATAFPAAAQPNSIVAPLWRDLDGATASTVKREVRGTAPYRRLIIQYNGVIDFNAVTTENFEVILYEGSDAIEYRYGTLNSTTPTTQVGLENSTGTVAGPSIVYSTAVGTGGPTRAKFLKPTANSCYPTGACCTSGTCNVVRYADCQSGDGTYLGDGSACPTAVTPPTAANANPSTVCPSATGNVTLTATGGSGTTLAWYTGSCGGTPVGTGSPLDVPAPGATTTYYARWENSCDASTCVSTTVTVEDTTAPVIHDCPGDIGPVNTDPGQPYATVSWTPPTATDNCTVVSLVSNHNPGDHFTCGQTSVTYTATDEVGLTDTCTFTVTVVDAEFPVFTSCPTTISQNTDAGVCTANVTWVAPTATDNKGTPVVAQTEGLPSGSDFPKGTTHVKFTATDPQNNVSVCEFDVIVSDAEIPTVVGCPSSVTTNSNTPVCSAVVSWIEPTPADNCPGSTIAQIEGPASGSTFAPGVTTIKYRATDASTNVSVDCVFTVTVTPTPDVNDDGNVDLLDVAPFADVLLGLDTDPLHMVRADANCDGLDDGLDVAPFIDAILP